MTTTSKTKDPLVGVSILTPSEAAMYLRIPESTIYKLAQQGTIPACKVGKHWRFVKEELHSWLVSNGHKKSTSI